jgi:hypothetical protein
MVNVVSNAVELFLTLDVASNSNQDRYTTYQSCSNNPIVTSFFKQYELQIILGSVFGALLIAAIITIILLQNSRLRRKVFPFRDRGITPTS